MTYRTGISTDNSFAVRVLLCQNGIILNSSKHGQHPNEYVNMYTTGGGGGTGTGRILYNEVLHDFSPYHTFR
jgi:hypothetical protein